MPIPALKITLFQPVRDFDDLAARFGLDTETLAKPRDSDILHDRPEDGEFFRLYSPSRDDGFFFAIVERRGDHQGFGANNAIFRLAAQKRQVSAGREAAWG